MNLKITDKRWILVLTTAALLLLFFFHIFFDDRSKETPPSHKNMTTLTSPRMVPAPNDASINLTIRIQRYSPPWLDDRELLNSRDNILLDTPLDAERAFRSAMESDDEMWIRRCVTKETWEILSSGNRLGLQAPPLSLDAFTANRYYYLLTVERDDDIYGMLYFKAALPGSPVDKSEEARSFDLFAYKLENGEWKRDFEIQKWPVYDLLLNSDPSVVYSRSAP